MIKAVAFDFDGVILESAGVKTQAFQKLFEKDFSERIEAILNYHRKNMGISRFVKFRYIYKKILNKPLSQEEEENLGHKFSSLVIQEVLEAPFVRGTLEFLEENHKRYSLFIVSGTPEKELRDIVKKRGVFHYFKEVHGSPKEKGDILRDILLRYHWQAGELAFVGDAESDLDASETTGVHFIARANGENHFREPFGRYCIKDMDELNHVLLKFERRQEGVINEP